MGKKKEKTKITDEDKRQAIMEEGTFKIDEDIDGDIISEDESPPEITLKGLVEALKPKDFGVKFYGLMPEHEKEAMEMVRRGVPLSEIAEHFGMAMSDIVYINKK